LLLLYKKVLLPKKKIMLILTRVKREARKKALSLGHVLGYFYPLDDVNNKFYNGEKVWFQVGCLNCNMPVMVSDKLNCHKNSGVNAKFAPIEITAIRESFKENNNTIDLNQRPFGVRAGGVFWFPNLGRCLFPKES
jgi:hypothetical protein